MDTLIALPTNAIVLILGSAIGSFLNVVVYRVPAGLSILWPPSRCPKCAHKLKASENIPIFGWLWLRGRCSNCKNPIAVRYPLVEAATGILFLLIYWRFGISWETVGYWAFFSWLLSLSLIDLDTMTLPNPLTKSGLVAGLGFQAIASSGDIHQLVNGMMGAVLGLWLLEIVAIVGSIAFGQAAMGAGDAKLAAMMGAWLGWKYLLLAGFIACFLGAVVGVGAIALGWLDRRHPMPFGPFLALGAAVTAMWGEQMLSTYLKLFLPAN